jgi:starch phosphorylase
MKHPKYAHSFEVVSELPQSIRSLHKLAYNFRWTWHHETRELFREIDRALWEVVEHNPVQLIARLSPSRLEKLATDPVFLARLNTCVEDLELYLTQDTWFSKTYPEHSQSGLIAYFCAEFGVSEALPIYSGGLGVLAGDHLKAASDLGVPLVAVGLLYSRGYFRQFLSPDGWQQEHYPQYDFYQLPLQLVRGQDQQPIHIEVDLPDRVVTCQVWRADVGRVPLYLLDSNVLENEPKDQGITDTLYGGDEEMRIRQEMILGLGGMRALKAIGLNPSVCHMNEGHAAFLSLERIRQFMQENQCDFRTARQVIVSGNVFTTHTPVPAGFDLFEPSLLERYVSKMAEAVDIEFPKLLSLGRTDCENQGEAFNMALLAMSNSDHVNGVSQLHAEVTRGMFQSCWPDFPEDEVPISAVTNGVHTMTWVCKRMMELFDSYLGADWKRDPSNPDVWKRVYDIPDRELWEARENQRGEFVRFVRKYLQRTAETRGLGKASYGQVESILDPRILTIGFARRFATYKRATLLMTDKERLISLIRHKERPVQFVLAGKSHPRDDGGKKLIQELANFINNEGGRGRVVFLEDYDMRVARAMVQGVDVWLNNPRRPMEASGTSGMKVVPNGVLNCSILDGWWDEGYEPGLGWAIGERYEVQDQGQQDWLDSRTLYHLLETEIAPNFYHRVDGVVPTGWVEMVKKSIAVLAPRFSTARMVREYTTRFYMPAAESYERLRNDHLQNARAVLQWRDKVNEAWSRVRIVSVKDSTSAFNSLGKEMCLEVDADLGGLSTADVEVQAVMGKVDSNRDLKDVQVFPLAVVESDGPLAKFTGTFKCDIPGHRGYTVRIVPKNDLINVASELKLVRWE